MDEHDHGAPPVTWGFLGCWVCHRRGRFWVWIHSSPLWSYPCLSPHTHPVSSVTSVGDRWKFKFRAILIRQQCMRSVCCRSANSLHALQQVSLYFLLKSTRCFCLQLLPRTSMVLMSFIKSTSVIILPNFLGTHVSPPNPPFSLLYKKREGHLPGAITLRRGEEIGSNSELCTFDQVFSSVSKNHEEKMIEKAKTMLFHRARCERTFVNPCAHILHASFCWMLMIR